MQSSTGASMESKPKTPKKSQPKKQSLKPVAKPDKPKQKRKPRSPEKKILAKTNPGGRPTKLTPEVEAQVVSAIRGGNYLETAAAYAGISKETLFTWLKEGANGKSPELTRFSDSIKRALAESEMLPLARIQKAGESSWQAEAWRLERRFPERWAKKPESQVNIQTSGAGETKITLGELYKQLNSEDAGT